MRADYYPFGFSGRCWLIICIGCLILCSCRTPGSLPVRRETTAGAGMSSEKMARSDTVHESLRRLPPTTAQDPHDVVRPASHEQAAAAGVHMTLGDDPAEAAPKPVVEAGTAPAAPWTGQGVEFPAAFLPGVGDPRSLPASAWGGGPSGWLPDDEYIFDGGDRQDAVRVAPDGTVAGLDAEDTVAYYRTRDGAVHTAASNPVAIYAPRFAAIRQVSGALLAHGRDDSLSLKQRMGVASQERREGADLAWMADFAELNDNVEALYAFRRRDLALGLHEGRPLQAFVRELLPYENLNYVRTGIYDNSEKARLANALTAAKTWSHEVALQVMIEGKIAYESSAGNIPEMTTRYEMPAGKPRLRLAKLASTQDAQPGDTVDFTIRFDNVGDQPIESLTLVDRLTPRLELIPESVKSSINAEFSATPGDDGTTLLRWSLSDKLGVGQGGIIQFRCLVR
ncbi:MAG: hypothetical protein KatS3mg110_1025 [Pirellulaceae bacterium]|nr:MAG: hypothetical protein KatS3mg110_1025 [Pirellulaceae bacterium]